MSKQTRKQDCAKTERRVNASKQTKQKHEPRARTVYVLYVRVGGFLLSVVASWLLQRDEKQSAALTRQKEALRLPPVTPLLSFDSFPKGVTPWLVAWAARPARQRLLLLYCGDARPEGAMSADSPPPPPSGWRRRSLDQGVERNDRELVSRWHARTSHTSLTLSSRTEFRRVSNGDEDPERSARGSPRGAARMQPCIFFSLIFVCFFISRSSLCFVIFVYNSLWCLELLFIPLYYESVRLSIPLSISGVFIFWLVYKLCSESVETVGRGRVWGLPGGEDEIGKSVVLVWQCCNSCGSLNHRKQAFGFSDILWNLW